jgi:integrase
MAWAEQRGPWFRVRYRDAGGIVRSTPDKYRRKVDAVAAAEDIDTDTRRGVFIDPNQSSILLKDWVRQFRAVHFVAPSTRAKNDQLFDNHILPALGEVGLDQIRRLAVKRWAGELGTRYAPATVRSIISLLSLVLTAAVEERILAINPIQGLRLADRRSLQGPGIVLPARKRPVPSGERVLVIAERTDELGDGADYVMVLASAFTGMRWGEITGLGRTNCHPADGYLLVDPDIGALHEVGGRLWLGPPKTEASARRIDLPPFLSVLLQEVMDSHDYEQLFVSAEGHWLRRSNFTRRIWRPACDGVPERGWEPILTGAVFHGLRHHHRTILDEARTEEVLKDNRMGHEMRGAQGIYSHVTDPMRDRLIKELQRRWLNLNGLQP